MIGIIVALSVRLTVIDGYTWEGVRGKVEINGRRYDLRNGILQVELPEGRYRIKVEAEGYNGIESEITVGENSPKDYEILLEPKNPINFPNEEKNFSIWFGWIRDSLSLEPVEGAEIKVITPSGVYTSKTNKEGFYIIKIPVKESTLDEKEPPKATVLITKEGYKSLQRDGEFIIEGVRRLNARISRGSGKTVIKKKHGLFEEKRSEKEEKKRFKRDTSEERLFATFLRPPSSIRVGRSCSCRTCSSVSIVSLEYYVQTGLDDEWIASWPPHSLRAGAVPYRSYGAWHVLNPISSSYDICDNACCQVWDPSDSYTSTQNAAIYTSGIMLEKSGNIARSEYSAENNNCGCGDGYSGDGVYWPCISDPVCSGATCYGHGRGMCQWGSYRWAYYYSSTWKNINNHYYNPGNMYLSTPFYIISASVWPSSLCWGDSMIIYLNVASYTQYTHDKIMFGASLYNGNWYSDPDKDVRVIINPDTQVVIRYFKIHDTVPPGNYDLALALWFDVDENYRINSADFMMNWFWLRNAVTVCSSSSIEEITRSINEPFKIYSVDGRLIPAKTKIPKGVYFIKSKGRVVKIFLR